jgi:Gpi18-like mannosyltransferase
MTGPRSPLHFSFSPMPVAAMHRATVIFLVAAIICRYAILPMTTEDQNIYLIPWLTEASVLKSDYLRHPFTNYTPFYEHALAFMALLPGPESVRIKLFSILFDIVLAAFVSRLVPAGHRMFTFALVLIIPTVVINAAGWGQADAIYASFVVAALVAADHRRPVVTMLAVGVAIAIKLQAIIIAPIIGLLILARRQPLWTLALVPLPYLVIASPMIIAGRPLPEIYGVYFNQFGTFQSLSANAPNIWMFLKKFVDYNTGLMIGLPFACIVIAGLTLAINRIKLINTTEGLLLAAAIVFIAVPFITPKMHERYFYLVDPTMAALCMHGARYIVPFVLAQMASLCSYVPFVVLTYDPDNWLLGPNGIVEQRLTIGWGLFPALGGLIMGLVLWLLLKVAMQFERDRARDRTLG